MSRRPVDLLVRANGVVIAKNIHKPYGNVRGVGIFYSAAYNHACFVCRYDGRFYCFNYNDYEGFHELPEDGFHDGWCANAEVVRPMMRRRSHFSDSAVGRGNCLLAAYMFKRIYDSWGFDWLLMYAMNYRERALYYHLDEDWDLLKLVKNP